MIDYADDDLREIWTYANPAILAGDGCDDQFDRFLSLLRFLDRKKNGESEPAPEPKKRKTPKCSNCQQEGHRKPYCPGIIKGAAKGRVDQAIAHILPKAIEPPKEPA